MAELAQLVEAYENATAEWHSSRKAVLAEVNRLNAQGVHATQIGKSAGLTFQQILRALAGDG